jgi:hypothetical protein
MSLPTGTDRVSLQLSWRYLAVSFTQWMQKGSMIARNGLAISPVTASLSMSTAAISSIRCRC